MSMYVDSKCQEMNTVIKLEPEVELNESDGYELDVENVEERSEINIDNHRKTDQFIVANLKLEPKNEIDDHHGNCETNFLKIKSEPELDDHVANLSEIHEAEGEDMTIETDINIQNYLMKMGEGVLEADKETDCDDHLKLTVTDHAPPDWETERFYEETSDIIENSQTKAREFSSDSSGQNEGSNHHANIQNHPIKMELSVCEADQETDGDVDLKLTVTDHGMLDWQTENNSNDACTIMKTKPIESIESTASVDSYISEPMKITFSKKPYCCEVCNKDFAKACYLGVHMRTHTGEKPYVCGVCDKRFTQSSSLSRHMEVHTRDCERTYVCEVCDKRFLHHPSLNKHLLIHNGERPYACNVCDKRFNRRFCLNRHIKIHSDEKT